MLPGRLLRSAALTAALALAWPVAAQESGGEGEGAASGQERVVPAMRFSIGEQFSAAQTCLDEGDIACAQEIVQDVAEIRDLNTYEEAQLYNFRAFLSFELDDTEAAIEAYESLMALPRLELPAGLISSSMRNLATLYLQVERMQEGLALYQEWMALPSVTPNSSDYYLLASIYYQLEEWQNGIDSIEQAIQLANDRGEIGEENWYVLLYVFNYNLERTDEVIETLTFLVQNWTKRRHIVSLAGQLSEQGRTEDTLTLYEAAYEAGFLERGTEWVQLANLYLSAETPYKAAQVLERGLGDGTIESTEGNWRTLAQAWQLAAEHEKALPPLERASELADNGQVDRLRAQSLARLARWEECVDAARRAIDRGGLREPGYLNMQLGQCLVNLRRFEEARQAFVAATEDERREDDARRFIAFVDEEMKREQANQEALAQLAQQQ